MWNRVRALLSARLGAQREGATFPVAALMMQGFITAVLCGLVRDGLPPFAYGIFALTVCGALVSVPLLGELSGLLTADEADDWVRALPASAFELKLARLLHLLIALGTLTLGSALPAVALAPAGVPLAGRALLMGGALAQALLIAAVLLTVQSALRGRAQALLVVAQTLLFLLVVVGSTLGLQYVGAMAGWRGPSDAGGLVGAFPPAWFSAGLADAATAPWKLAAPGVALLSLAVLIGLPPPPRDTARRGQPLLSLVLSPVRALATRFWVAQEERGPFDLVFDALPKEREFVLRTYPLIAVPLAFLVVDPSMLAVLVFTPGVWLPILLMHVPASSSASARWILETAPVAPASVSNGALKAVVVRFVLPLYAVLGVVAALVGGLEFALYMVPPGFLVSIFVLRGIWSLCVEDAPLSVAPEDVRVQYNLLSILGTLAVVLCIVAIGAMLVLDRPLHAAAATTVLVLAELAADRSWRAGALGGPATGPT